jgi:hypothetical protein
MRLYMSRLQLWLSTSGNWGMATFARRRNKREQPILLGLSGMRSDFDPDSKEMF